MTSQRFSFLLILILLITPILSTFSYYTSMVDQLSAAPVMSLVADMSNDTTMSSDQCQNHKAKVFCETKTSCSFSVCGYGYIATLFLLLTRAYCSLYRYRKSLHSFLRSLFFPPEIKPPIYSL